MKFSATPQLTPLWQVACREAASLKHGFVCLEHLLLALAGETGQDAARFLGGHGYGYKQLRKLVVKQVGQGRGTFQPTLPSLRALGVIRLADEAASSHSHEWTPLYLLWALLLDRDSDVAHMLNDQGVDLDSWTAALEERMGEPTRRRPGVFTLDAGEAPGHASELRRWRDRLTNCNEYLRTRVIGQQEAVERVSQALIRSWAGLNEAGRPLASFVLAGPRGSGKTTLAQHLSEYLYQDRDRLIRVNMEEFSELSRAWRLTGVPSAVPGEQEGELTSLAREYPYAVFYLEEANRAHPRALEVLRQVLSRGHLYDGRGQRAEFRDDVLFLQVTLDPELLELDGPVGFRLSSREKTPSLARLERQLLPELERALGSETLELVDDVILLRPLGVADLQELLEKWTDSLSRKLRHRRRVELTIDPAVGESLAKKARDGGEGADSLKRIFTREIEDRLAQAMLLGRLREGDRVQVELDGEEITVRTPR